ncbi:MAG TPA: arylsulfatase [Verrucomicrobiae bacterium]|nr:arylsulfatase [Verrucomicrobiae bacterium]
MRNARSMRVGGGLWTAIAVYAVAVLPGVGQPAGSVHLPPPPAGPAHPNIILIVADDLGYGDLGCYGQEKIRTPNLDRLAAAGTRFTSFYAGSTVCAPSRSCLMTGQHTGHTRIRGNAKGATLAPDDVTLAMVLQEAGYKTGMIGKWSLGGEGTPGQPGAKGFDDFVGYLDQTRAHDYYAPYLDRFDHADGERHIEFPKNFSGAKGIYFPDVFNKAALNFIRINKPDPFNKERPFFLYLPYTLPHANNELGRQTGNGMEVPDDQPYAAQPWPQPEKNKAAMITRLDKYVGEIMVRLQQYHQESNTLILFTSDNGPHAEGGVDPEFFHSAGPFRGLKRDLYEGGIRVPLIAVWPGRIPAGRVSDETWAFWDLFSTLADVAGARLPQATDGLSYLPTLLNQTQTNRHEFFYWEFHERGFKQAVRMGDWKAVRLTANGPLELYNLTPDPGETRNVAADHPEIITRIEAYLKTARTDSPQWPIQARPPKKQPAHAN